MIRLHHVPQSRSMRVLWLLNELGLEFDLVVWPFDKTLRSAQYLALKPGGPGARAGDRRPTLFRKRGADRAFCVSCNPEGRGWAVRRVIRSGRNGSPGCISPKPSASIPPALYAASISHCAKIICAHPF